MGSFKELWTNQPNNVIGACLAILGAFSVFQTGLVDRENKAKLNKLVEHIERLEGENSGIIDI